MLRAIHSLSPAADYLLIDAITVRGCSIPQTAIVRGDATCLSIASASIVAKVLRDQWMNELDHRHPAYDWAHNKGYGTVAHRRGLARRGLSAFHRRSFAPIRALLEGHNG